MALLHWILMEKEMSVEKTYYTLGIVLGVGGVMLIGVTVSWWAALGVFLVIWGNNITWKVGGPLV